MQSTLDCSTFLVRHDFDTYITLLLNATDNDLSRLVKCRSEVCTALWGQGNSDISGIGVSKDYTAYVKKH